MTATSRPLTARQQQVVRYLRRFHAARGVMPTYAEMARYFRITPMVMYDHIDRLERKGYVRRRPHVPRGLELVGEGIAPPRPPCRHCNRRSSSHRSGLCCICYRDRDIRSQYVRPPAPWGLAARPGNAPLPPPAPTTALPGSEEKMRVLAERLAAGFALFHRDDAGTRRDDDVA